MVAVNCRTVKRRFKAWGMGQAMQSSQGGTGGLSQLTTNITLPTDHQLNTNEKSTTSCKYLL
jgi:hypothetical protein